MAENSRKQSKDPDSKMRNASINDDTDDEDETADDIELGPAVLGLQRVGAQSAPKTAAVASTSQQQSPVLNARGMPARIRKKNRMFFDDELVNTPHHRVPSTKKQRLPPTTPKKVRTPSSTPTPKSREKERNTSVVAKKRATSPVAQSPDRRIGQKIGLRLRNLLKLPKAHKWVCYEWFLSNIDRSLFNGDNDFQICLKETFPTLKTRKLTRAQWTIVRRMMGKPRRCSPAFFHQERLDLEKKRNKIRALQQRKVTDVSAFLDLPPEIPIQLVIGTKVTARLRKPQDGLFTGSVDAVDTSNNTYRITFERVGLGTHSVPDFEVLSNDVMDTMQIYPTPRRNGSGHLQLYKSPAYSVKLRRDRDPMLSGYMLNKSQPASVAGKPTYPSALLEHIVVVDKILKAKKRKIDLLKTMNTEAERLKSFEEVIPEDFQRRYAGILMDLERLNKDLQDYLDEMQTHCHELSRDSGVIAMLTPSHLREKAMQSAGDMVKGMLKCGGNKEELSGYEDVTDMIKSMTALMIAIKSLGATKQNVYELQVLAGTMEMMKQRMSEETRRLFQTMVECHIKHIQESLSVSIARLAK